MRIDVQPRQRMEVTHIMRRYCPGLGPEELVDAAGRLVRLAIDAGRNVVPSDWIDGQPCYPLTDLELVWSDYLDGIEGCDRQSVDRIISALKERGYVLTVADWQGWSPTEAAPEMGSSDRGRPVDASEPDQGDGSQATLVTEAIVDAWAAGFATDASFRSLERLDLYGWQREAGARWLEGGMRGVVEAVTGSGKTRLGLAVAWLVLATDPGSRVVVLVPKVELMHQWRSELASWLGWSEGDISCRGGGEHGSITRSRVAVYVAASASRHLPADIGSLGPSAHVLLVADECHRYGAETYRLSLDAPYAATLGLSATPERSHDLGMEEHVLPALGPVIYRYDHADALADHVISDFEVAFVGLTFDAVEGNEYADLSARIQELQRVVDSKHPKLRRRRDYFARLSTIARDEEDPAVLAFLAAIGERRIILMGAMARRRFVEWLVGNLPEGEKAIAFHETIEGAEQVVEALDAAGIPAAAHHSGLSAPERRAMLEAFGQGRLRAIAAPRTLDEGIDVPDASLAILVAGSTVKRQRIQRIGRVLRRAPGKRAAHVIVLYVLGSREDPITRLEGDAFAEAMEALDRAWYFTWPDQYEELWSWLNESLPERPDLRRPSLVVGDSPVALVVSDQEVVRQRAIEALGGVGVESYWTDDPGLAADWIMVHRPSIIVVDRELPTEQWARDASAGSETFRLCREIRDLEGGHSMTVVVVGQRVDVPSTFGHDLSFRPHALDAEAVLRCVRRKSLMT